MRPIDADALIKKYGDWYVEEGTESGFIGTLENLLATEPTIQPQSTDLIDRQAAIDAVRASYDEILDFKSTGRTVADSVEDIISELPSVQPEHKVRFADKDHVWIDGKQYISLPRFQEAVKEAQPKEGHWIWVAGELMCSECRTIYSDLYPDYDNAVACPHCGAKMKGEQHETD